MQNEVQDEAGRAIVRELLVNRLALAGLKPRRGVTVADQAKVTEHLVVSLSYMAAINLRTLAETVLAHAAQPGPGQGQWPSEVLVRAWAEALQARPFSQHPIISSWLRSVEGPMAVAGGYLVELLRWLQRHRRALTPGDLAQVKRQADEVQRSLVRIRERIEKGVPWPDDHELLSSWMRDYAEALQYVDEGNARRAARPAEGDANEVAA